MKGWEKRGIPGAGVDGVKHEHGGDGDIVRHEWLAAGWRGRRRLQVVTAGSAASGTMKVSMSSTV